MKTLSQLELNVNNTLEVYHYFNKLISENQIIQWIELYREDFIKQCINQGQPLGILILLEFDDLSLYPSQLLLLSTNFINRVHEFNNYILSNKYKFPDYDYERMYQYIDLLILNPVDFSLLERSFTIYIEYCFKYKDIDSQIGVYKRWLLN
jgi:hypothetical protein